MKTATPATALTRRVGAKASDYATYPKRTVAQGSRGGPADLQTFATPGGDLFPALSLAIHREVETLRPCWTAFEKEAEGTLFQNSLWCRAWLETVGARRVVQPVIVTGHEAGRLCLLLPLQIRPRFSVRVLEWLGSPNHNYGYPLLGQGFAASAGAWFTAHWPLVLDRIGDYDAVALTSNPGEMFGRPHPLAAWRTISGASPSYSLALESEPETLRLRKFSSSRLKTEQRKDLRLTGRGVSDFGLPASRAEAHAVLDTLFAQQEQRLSDRGVAPVFAPEEKRFFHRIIDMQEEPATVLQAYRLTLDGAVIAVLAGGVQAGTFWALLTSLAGGDIGRYSPGDMVLRRTIDACCRSGIARFDFSPGDFSYKRRWADDVTENFAILAAASPRGLVWAAAMALALTAKRWIKRMPVLVRIARLLRKELPRPR